MTKLWRWLCRARGAGDNVCRARASEPLTISLTIKHGKGSDQVEWYGQSGLGQRSDDAR